MKEHPRSIDWPALNRALGIEWFGSSDDDYPPLSAAWAAEAMEKAIGRGWRLLFWDPASPRRGRGRNAHKAHAPSLTLPRRADKPEKAGVLLYVEWEESYDARADNLPEAVALALEQARLAGALGEGS